MKQHTKGERITVYNGVDKKGNKIVEGTATLIVEVKQLCSGEFPAWRVRFDGEGEPVVIRTVY
jgi:hypothetical protein